MKKTFQLKVTNKNVARQVDSIKNEVRKYIKREKSKKLPEEFNIWKFNCKFGKTLEEAKEIPFTDIIKSIDFAAAQDYDSFYLEIMAFADVKVIKNNDEKED
ncbi:DUF6172 family protein [Arcobacter lacus]|uniref:Phage protein n=1 Tax=Arcobacter lacus TaxID=1912876 RepID=A0ABX5JIN3_9BACT|nr:DUF6172 family protein [Arcobacter lacus]MCT7911272.1 DUF6172 family protein [Arcobacter lacus]PUE64668.1 hypothetical protein B0175_09635 [Arcobacter lacus]